MTTLLIFNKQNHHIIVETILVTVTFVITTTLICDWFDNFCNQISIFLVHSPTFVIFMSPLFKTHQPDHFLRLTNHFFTR